MTASYISDVKPFTRHSHCRLTFLNCYPAVEKEHSRIDAYASQRGSTATLPCVSSNAHHLIQRYHC